MLKNTGHQGSTLSNQHMTKYFGPYSWSVTYFRNIYIHWILDPLSLKWVREWILLDRVGIFFMVKKMSYCGAKTTKQDPIAVQLEICVSQLECMFMCQNVWLTSNTLWDKATPVSTALTTLAFSEPGSLYMMCSVAHIDSNRPKSDIIVAHNTAWQLSTVLHSSTSLIWSHVYNSKVLSWTSW